MFDKYDCRNLIDTPSKIVGTAYFTDGHSEPILTYKVFNTHDSIDFKTESGWYCFGYVLERCDEGFFHTVPRWGRKIDDRFVRVDDLIDRIELKKG